MPNRFVGADDSVRPYKDLLLWQKKKRMGSKKRFFGCIKRRKKRADEGIGPYKAQYKPEVQI